MGSDTLAIGIRIRAITADGVQLVRNGLAADGIIGIEYHGSQLVRPICQQVQHRTLGSHVGLESAVVVEMFMGNVGETGQVQFDFVRPVLRQAVAGAFEYGNSATVAAHAVQCGLYVPGIRGRDVKTGIGHPSTFHETQSGHGAGLETTIRVAVPMRGFQNAGQQAHRRCLTVGPRDAHGCQPAGRKSEPESGSLGKRAFAVLHPKVGRQYQAASGTPGFNHGFGLRAQDQRGTGGNRIGNVQVTIRLQARLGDEDITCIHFPAVPANRSEGARVGRQRGGKL